MPVVRIVSSVAITGYQGSNATFSSELTKFDPRARPGQKNPRAEAAYQRNREHNRVANVNYVPMRPQTGANGTRISDKNASFGQRRGPTLLPGSSKSNANRKAGSEPHAAAMEMSWVPSSSGGGGDNSDVSGRPKKDPKRKGVEEFGAGMEKGGEDRSVEISESDRRGRTQRRHGVRSGSKNVFRRMDG